jgi:hypothetical protein
MTTPDKWALLERAHWKNSGICYSRAAFYDKADAEAFAAAVKADGGTVNGGWFDGMPLGNLQPSRNGEMTVWEVMY